MRAAALFSLLGGVLAAQNGSLVLSSGSAVPGGSVTVALNLTPPAGNLPSGLQWTLSYSASDVASVSVAAGPALTAAGKAIYCYSVAGSTTCLGIGLNTTGIGGGVVAQVTAILAPSITGSTVPISLGATLGVLADGTAMAISGVGAGITLPNAPSTALPVLFADVAQSDYFFQAVDLLYAAGITRGCGLNPLTFCPNDNVTRGQMAAFLVRAALGGDPATFNPVPYFADVPATNLFFGSIQRLYELGITNGCSANPLMFCPDDLVTRGQMSAFIIRSRYGPLAPFSYPAAASFTDVPASYPFFNYIQKMAQVGITSGCGVGVYCPASPTTRGQMAVFLARGLLNDLLPAGTAVVTSASPATVAVGQTANVALYGANTSFATSSSVYAGAGVTVNSVTVMSGQVLVASLSISATAQPGPRSLVVSTPVAGGTEEAVLPNGLTVQ